MRLVSFNDGGETRIGVVVADKVVPVNAMLPASERVSDDMTAFLAAGEPAMRAARAAAEAYERGAGADTAIDLKDADLLAPVPRPGKILMGGRNYLRHLDELRREGSSRGEKIITPPMPHIFAKYHDSVTGHGNPVIYPKIVRQLDLEGELVTRAVRTSTSRLQIAQQLADPLEKHRARSRELQHAALLGTRLVRGPALVSEQLGFEEMLRHGAAVHRDERLAVREPRVMHRAGEQLLSSAGLADDHDGGQSGGRDLARELQCLADGSALTDHVMNATLDSHALGHRDSEGFGFSGTAGGHRGLSAPRDGR